MNMQCPSFSRFARLLITLSCVVTLQAHAQHPAPLPQPDLQLLRAGSVNAIARQPDGSLVIGGSFSSVAGIPRDRIARILPDGTLDPNWNPSTNGIVNALAVDASGAVYAGGRFTTMGGLPRNRIAKLSGSGTGSVDASWNPSANGDVLALAMAPGGALIVAGRFSFIGGQVRTSIARLATTGAGAADTVWSPFANAWVESLAVDATGAVYAGGLFTTIGGQPRAYIARLSGSGTGNADPTWNPAPNGAVNDLALDPGGALFAGGVFSAIGGASRSYLAKLSVAGTGNADPSWNPSPDNIPEALAVDASGGLYVGGQFSFIGGQPRDHVARLSTSGTGAADSGWQASANLGPQAFIIGSDGTVHMGGAFSVVGGQSRIGIAQVSSNGQVIGMPADVVLPGYVTASAVQANGGLIVAGAFSKANGQTRYGLLRLNPDRTLDPDWAPAVDGWVSALAVNALGEVYAGGRFTSIGGQPFARLARLAADGNGAADPIWNPAPDGEVTSIALDGSGSVHVGGGFSSIGGEARSFLARLSASGSGAADPAWNPSADDTVSTLGFDASGRLYAGGKFTLIGGQSHNRIARFLPGGSATPDSLWNPSANWTVETLVVDDSGAVYAGGYFSHMNDQPRSGIAKLAGTDGNLDPAWNPTASGGVLALLLDGNGFVCAGGDFTEIGGLARSYLARLSVDGAGDADPAWSPSPNSIVESLSIHNEGLLHVGGFFTAMGSTTRHGIAALPISDILFQDGFDGDGARHGSGSR